MPLTPARAEGVAGQADSILAEARSPIRDVELAQGGVLIGRVLDANGQPIADSEVSVLAGGKCVATTRTDDKGVFAIAGLRGGVHQINTSENMQLCRLWAHSTAPPQATSSVEIVSGMDIFRGQWGPPPGNGLLQKAKVLCTNPFIVGGIVAAAVAIPIALSNNDDGPES